MQLTEQCCLGWRKLEPADYRFVVEQAATRFVEHATREVAVTFRSSASILSVSWHLISDQAWLWSRVRGSE